MSTLSNDFRFALRTLAKNPAFTVTAVVTLAIGIGASTAIFSVVDAVLLRPLPYADAGRLVLVETDMVKRKLLNFPVPPGDYPDIVDHGTSFSGVAGVATFSAPLTSDGGDPEQITQANVTTNLFPLMGVRLAFGRDFVASDGDAPPAAQGTAQGAGAAPPVPNIVILSHEFWMRRYGGDSSVVGRTISIFGAPAQIVGVLAPGAALLFPNDAALNAYPDVYSALRIDYRTASRLNVFMRLVARLKPGATLVAAQHDMDQAAVAINDVVPVAKAANFRIRVVPMDAGLVADVRPGLLALMGAVSLVLLIACANVSNLLLVRASSRHRELAVRAALGSSRSQLVQQMLAESAVLAVAGTAIGLAIAQLGIQLLLALGPADLPRAATVSIDPAVLGFAVLVAVAAAAVFGVLPALRASRPQLADALRAAGRSPSLQGAGRLRDGVVVFEIALSFVLLVGCGLMVRSLETVVRADPGFDPHGLLTVLLTTNGRDKNARQQFDIAVQHALVNLPGVTGVTAAGPFPMDGLPGNVRWGTAEAEADPARFQQADIHIVLPGYFETMRTRLLAGRAFTEGDNDSSSNRIVIDDILAAKAFPGISAIGKQLLVRARTPTPEYLTIVGVVAHQRNAPVPIDTHETLFMTDGQFTFGAAVRWVIRTDGDPGRLAPAVRAAIRGVDPQLAVSELQPAQVFIDRSGATTRFALTLIAVFAAIAALLASVGLYGVLSTIVRQRTAEIGVRLAFGATASNIFRLVIGRGMALSAIGIALGVGVALMSTRVMRTLLVGVGPNDPATYAAIVVLFAGVALAACWLPARRAAALEPNVALRDD